MYEVSFLIEGDEIRSKLIATGKVASFSNIDFDNYFEVVHFYCCGEDSGSAVSKVLNTLSLALEDNKV